jgi:hypothetical protein
VNGAGDGDFKLYLALTTTGTIDAAGFADHQAKIN